MKISVCAQFSLLCPKLHILLASVFILISLQKVSLVRGSTCHITFTSAARNVKPEFEVSLSMVVLNASLHAVEFKPVLVWKL